MSELFMPTVSVERKARRTNTPELTVVAGGNGNIKINEAASELFKVGHREYLWIGDNSKTIIDAIREAEKEGDTDEVKRLKAIETTFFACRGFVRKDSKGKAIKVLKRLTNAEKAELEAKFDMPFADLKEGDKPVVDDCVGFKVAATGAAGEGDIGLILSGSDKNSWTKLGGEEDVHKVYTIAAEGISHDLGSGEVTLHVLTYDRDEDKMVRS